MFQICARRRTNSDEVLPLKLHSSAASATVNRYRKTNDRTLDTCD